MSRMIHKSVSSSKRRPLLLAVWQEMQVGKKSGCVVCTEKKIEPILGQFYRGINPLEIDHIVPVSEGGGNEIENLQWLCRYHNRQKGRNPVTEKFRFKIKEGIVEQEN